MEGVTILETIADGKFTSSGLWCITICCFAFACSMAYDIYNNWKHKNYYFSIGLCGVVIACLFSICLAWNDGAFDDTKYIVSIDDSVNFNEFSEKYQILERNGEKYTVREIANFGQSTQTQEE